MTAVQALQTTLAAEHAAVYVYGVLGARTSQSGAPTLYAAIQGAYDEHRARRDRLIAEIADLGETPVATAPSYEVPGGLVDTTAVTAAAADLEDGCATTYAALVAETSGAARRRAVNDLTNAAIRVLTFRGTPEMFPGAGEYADR